MQGLREMRKTVGLTQRQVSKMIGKSITALSLYESGDRTPSFNIVQDLARIYGCDFETVAKCFIKEEK